MLEKGRWEGVGERRERRESEKEMMGMGKRTWKEGGEKVCGEDEGRSCRRRELERISSAEQSHDKGSSLEGPNRSQNPQQSGSLELGAASSPGLQ